MMLKKVLSSNLALVLVAMLTACSNDMCKAGRAAKVKQVSKDEVTVVEAKEHTHSISHEHIKNVVFFAFDSSDLTAEGKEALDKAAAAVKANGRVDVLVTGHCSAEGSDAYNYGLGERRANAAASYLLNTHGIGSKISSYGKSMDFGGTPEHNRRAMIHVGKATFAETSLTEKEYPKPFTGKSKVVVKKGKLHKHDIPHAEKKTVVTTTTEEETVE